MNNNFHLLFYIRKQKNYKGVVMPIYMRITVIILPEAVHQLLLKNKIKRDRNDTIEKDARAKLKAIIKASSTAP